ncbi:MAG TPA: L,D-transpeptidase family protein [Streptosporangiaceae bacterium]|nr:L,D-transpeptidase family protein [Streptosporangiaceae bacterium]
MPAERARDGGHGVFGEGRPGQQAGSSGTDGGEKPSRPSRAAAGGGENRPPDVPARRSGRPGNRVIGIAVVTAAVAVAGTVYAVTQSSGGGGQGASGPGLAAASGPMHVRWMAPDNLSTGVNGASPITISFSDPVAANSPRPTLQPSVAGRWSSQGSLLVFTPYLPFSPSSQVTINIPGGRSGVRSASGALLAASQTDHFRTGSYSQEGLAELLTQQGYLPMTFTPVSTGLGRVQSPRSSPDPASQTPAGEAYSPLAGSFTFDSGYPSSLQSQWNPDSANVLLRGAVMAFQSEHNMTVNGDLTSKFWNALFLAQQRGEQNKNGYTYAVADQHDPETLTIYHNGHFVMRSLTNTGIPVSPTVNGTFPVYARYRFQIMSGTNPGGSHYADPVSFVSYFNGGDAVHYFPRGGYGYQQSLGCVELPYNAAEQAYPYLTYGSLVTVMG